MDKIVVVVFDDEMKAYEGVDALHDLHMDGSITLYTNAVIAKDAGGKIALRLAPDTGPAGTLFGLLAGGLVGLLGGPVGIALGAGTGTRTGEALDRTRADVGAEFVAAVSEVLLPGKSAVIMAIDEGWQAPIDARMEALGGLVFRRNRIAVEDAYYEKELAAYREELHALENELGRASAERKARLDARIKDTRLKIEDKENELKARIEAIRREGDAKITSLQQQLTTARDDRRARLKKRLAEVRAEYRMRSGRLHEAWELTRSALTL